MSKPIKVRIYFNKKYNLRVIEGIDILVDNLKEVIKNKMEIAVINNSIYLQYITIPGEPTYYLVPFNN